MSSLALTFIDRLYNSDNQFYAEHVQPLLHYARPREQNLRHLSAVELSILPLSSLIPTQMTSVLDQNYGSESDDENFNPAPADDSDNEAADGSDAEVNITQGARQRRGSSLGSNDSAGSPAQKPNRRKNNGIVSNGAGLGEDGEDDEDGNGSVRDEDEEEEEDDDDDDDEGAVTVFYSFP